MQDILVQHFLMHSISTLKVILLTALLIMSAKQPLKQMDTLQ